MSPSPCGPAPEFGEGESTDLCLSCQHGELTKILLIMIIINCFLSRFVA
jgi:hypothetical protein